MIYKATEKFDKELFELVVGRSQYQLLDVELIHNLFYQSRVLITGAGGSIGSSIAKRLIQANVNNVFFLDRDESALHSLALELSHKSNSQLEKCYIADIRDPQSIHEAIEQIKPTMVIHAAALKHLVVLERFPREGFLTNLLGTLNVAQICVKNNVKQFINISTDKAANPTSVLGKTKKLAELISEEVFKESGLIQSSVRFGNVFGSRGSVIETFMHQIQNNLPVTVSDKNVARFFMSHQEASNLVLAVASLNKSGTYIQNMGDEVLITDVVHRIAEYFNKNPIIEFNGLKTGEKLNEELFDGEIQETKFESIFGSVHSYPQGLVEEVLGVIPKNNSEANIQIAFLVEKYLRGLK